MRNVLPEVVVLTCRGDEFTNETFEGALRLFDYSPVVFSVREALGQ
jgi:hypothetical protein